MAFRERIRGNLERVQSDHSSYAEIYNGEEDRIWRVLKNKTDTNGGRSNLQSDK